MSFARSMSSLYARGSGSSAVQRRMSAWKLPDQQPHRSDGEPKAAKQGAVAGSAVSGQGPVGWRGESDAGCKGQICAMRRR